MLPVVPMSRLQLAREVLQLRKEMRQSTLVLSALLRMIQKIKYDQSATGFTVVPDGKAYVRSGTTSTPTVRKDVHLRRLSDFPLISLSELVNVDLHSDTLTDVLQ
jgi:hypothetical protein